MSLTKTQEAILRYLSELGEPEEGSMWHVPKARSSSFLVLENLGYLVHKGGRHQLAAKLTPIGAKVALDLRNSPYESILP